MTIDSSPKPHEAVEEPELYHAKTAAAEDALSAQQDAAAPSFRDYPRMGISTQGGGGDGGEGGGSGGGTGTGVGPGVSKRRFIRNSPRKNL